MTDDTIWGRPGRRRLLLSWPAAALLARGGAAWAAPAPAPLGEAQLTRLVSIGGAVTETVYALGMQARIVAVDTTSLYPPEALRDKKSVGYMRALSAEGVLSVGPSAILLLDGAGPPPVVDLLRRSGVPVVTVDGSPTPVAVAVRARFLGNVLGVAEKGDALAAEIDAGFLTLAAARKAERRPSLRAMFVMSIRGGRPLAAGRGTAADAMIGLAGGANVMAGFEGYKAVTDEAVIEAAPQLVLTMAGGDGSGGAAAVKEAAAFRGTPAGRNGAVVEMDGETLLGFGPRTPAVALDLLRRFEAAAR